MTELSPLWVRRVAPLDDGFVPYVAPNYQQYKPGLFTYPQPVQNASPLTARGVNVQIQQKKKTKNGQTRKPPDYADKIPISMSLPLGPDIKHKPYDKAYEVPKFKQYITPYREYTTPYKDPEYKDYLNVFPGDKTKKASKPRPIARKPGVKNKNTKQVRVKEEPKTYKANDMAVESLEAAEDWKKPYEQAGEAAVMSWIKLYEQGKVPGNSRYGYPVSRYELQYNPQGAMESLKRTNYFMGPDF